METTRWHYAFARKQYHPFLKEGEARTRRLSGMGLLDLPRDAAILDVGCGTGPSIAILLEHGYTNVRGVEPSEALVESSPVKAQISLGTADKLEFADRSFDCVFVSGVLHHLGEEPAIVRCFQEIHRVLKPGGTFAYNEPYQTIVRTLGNTIIFSPIGNWWSYSQKMRVILEEEKDHIAYWLSHADQLEKRLWKTGFERELRRVGLFRITVKARKR